MVTIGMFDSGVGGLSVLKETRKLLPHASLLYLADQAFAPYGDRDLSEVRVRSDAITRRLIAEGAQMVVIACHTASAAALHELRQMHPSVPIVGIEPAVKPAAERTETRTVGVLATSATFQGTLFSSVVSRFATRTRIIARPCPGLADLVEVGADESQLEQAISEHLGHFEGRHVDQIVLGCTHYSFLAGMIERMSGVSVVDPAPAVAAQVARVALTLGGESATGGVRYITTGDPSHLAKRIEGLLGEVAAVSFVDI